MYKRLAYERGGSKTLARGSVRVRPRLGAPHCFGGDGGGPHPRRERAGGELSAPAFSNRVELVRIAVVRESISTFIYRCDITVSIPNKKL